MKRGTLIGTVALSCLYVMLSLVVIPTIAAFPNAVIKITLLVIWIMSGFMGIFIIPDRYDR